VVIERSFDAPGDLIWQMSTDPEHFKAWYRPVGATIPVAKMDVRTGGTRLVCREMQTPDGRMQMWFTGKYREVVDNQRLVYTESVSDANGNASAPSDIDVMALGHPMTTETRVELEDVGWPHEDGDDPYRSSRRPAGCRRMGDGVRQACRPRRNTQRPVVRQSEAPTSPRRQPAASAPALDGEHPVSRGLTSPWSGRNSCARSPTSELRSGRGG
jgi:uncharacterized protein YndB with AHSA1/START domain